VYINLCDDDFYKANSDFIKSKHIKDNALSILDFAIKKVALECKEKNRFDKRSHHDEHISRGRASWFSATLPKSVVPDFAFRRLFCPPVAAASDGSALLAPAA